MEILKQTACTICIAVLFGENPFRGVSPRLRKKLTVKGFSNNINPDRIPMGVAGPLPEGIVGLVLGCSSLSFQEISVVYGVVDSDYIGEIIVLISPLTKTVQINKGQE